MAGFVNVNTGNRILRSVGGRVLVFTDSKKVEYVEESRRYSYPLYSYVNGIPFHGGYTFVVEFKDGYLSFDPNAEVRITEIGPYVNGYFLPGVSIVVSADPFQSQIASAAKANLNTPYPAGYTPAPAPAAGQPQNYNSCRVYLTSESSGQIAAYFMFPYKGFYEADAFISAAFPTNSLYKGPKGYPGFTFLI